MSSPKPAWRAFSLASLQERTTSLRMEGMKCRSLLGRNPISVSSAKRRSRRAGKGVLLAVDNIRACSSELRDSNACTPVVELARRGISLYAFLTNCGSEDTMAGLVKILDASKKRDPKEVRGRCAEMAITRSRSA